MNSDDKILAAVATCVFAAGGALATWCVIADGSVDVSPAVENRPVVARTQSTPPPSDVQYAKHSGRQGLGDQALRAVIAELSSHPELATWLMTDELTERLVGAVEAVAQGSSPRVALDFLAPQSQFLVHDYKLDYAIAQGTYRRFDVATEVFVSLDVDGLVSTFGRIAPSIDREYARASWAGDGFEHQLEQAVAHLLEVDVPDGPIEVERRTVAYVFAEDSLQSLSAAQKQLLRMGPRNATKIQAKLREIQEAFGWTTESASAGIVTADNTGTEADVKLNPTLIAALTVDVPNQAGVVGEAEISSAGLEAAVDVDLPNTLPAPKKPAEGTEGSAQEKSQPPDVPN